MHAGAQACPRPSTPTHHVRGTGDTRQERRSEERPRSAMRSIVATRYRRRGIARELVTWIRAHHARQAGILARFRDDYVLGEARSRNGIPSNLARLPMKSLPGLVIRSRPKDSRPTCSDWTSRVRMARRWSPTSCVSPMCPSHRSPTPGPRGDRSATWSKSAIPN